MRKLLSIILLTCSACEKFDDHQYVDSNPYRGCYYNNSVLIRLDDDSLHADGLKSGYSVQYSNIGYGLYSNINIKIDKNGGMKFYNAEKKSFYRISRDQDGMYIYMIDDFGRFKKFYRNSICR